MGELLFYRYDLEEHEKILYCQAPKCRVAYRRPTLQKGHRVRLTCKGCGNTTIFETCKDETADHHS